MAEDGIHTYTDALRILVTEGNLVISGSNSGAIEVWDYETAEHKWTLKEHTESVVSLHVLDNLLFTTSYDAKVCVWNLTSGNLMHVMEGPHDDVTVVRGTKSYVLKGMAGSIFSMIILNKERVLTGGGDGKIRVWDMKNGLVITNRLLIRSDY
jgi:WD40 repeat protein